MSDFLLTNRADSAAELTARLRENYPEPAPSSRVFSGSWGSLSVLENHYHGFSPHETSTHICVVIGGPLLGFRENDFLDEPGSSTGTEAILERHLAGEMTWDEDLSGPFAVLVVDKNTGEFSCITDLLLFVPVYTCETEDGITVGSHVDSVARAAGVEADLDLVSVADFTINHVVTFPHTCYESVKQLDAGTNHRFPADTPLSGLERDAYWVPEEKTRFDSLNEAADTLREGLLHDVREITRGTDRVAAFISAGEDSRTILGSLPEEVACDGFTYLYASARDRRIAEQVTGIFDVRHSVGEQGYHYYLDILSGASALVGSGHQYSHAHVVGFFEEWELRGYRAVLGGYLSDSLLKGLFSRKRKARGLLSWLPEFPRSGETHSRRQHSDFFTETVLEEVRNRKREHMARVREIRPETAHEWFGIWPATMQLTFPNYLATRRLFRSYEPFMGKTPVKVGAGTPLTWKLNRRLFNRATRPLLRRTRWVAHADGHFPYFPFWFNMPFVFLDKLKKYATKFYHGLTCVVTGKETPWQRRRASKTDPEWQEAFASYEKGYDRLSPVVADPEARKKFSSRQTRNLLQVLEWLDRIAKEPKTPTDSRA